MLTELGVKIADMFPLLRNRPDIVDAIVGLCNGEMWAELDFPHQPLHNFRVNNDTRCIAALLNVEPWENILLEKAAVIHDLGRNFVQMGCLEENEHQNGSFVLAKVIAMLHWGFTEPLADHFAEGVALHVEDALPEDTPRWVRILRDADRTARLGMGGMIELAWYQGYRDSYISTTGIEKLLDDQLLFDSALPTDAESIAKYDEKPRAYFEKYILPFLVENNKLHNLVGGIKVLIDRIYGVPSGKKEESKWKIEPVSAEAQFLSRPRIKSMNRFLEEYYNHMYNCT